MKYLIIVIAVLVCFCVLQHNQLTELKIENSKLEDSNAQLVVEIKRRDSDIVEISKRKEELKKSVNIDENSENSFAWDYDINGSEPIRVLRKQCLSCSTRAD